MLENMIVFILGSAITIAATYISQSNLFNRETKRRQYEREEEIKHKRQVMSAAFCGEISSLLSIIERREITKTLQNDINYIEKGGLIEPGKFMSVGSDSFFAYYKSNIGNIGMLGPKIVPKIIEFYINLFGLVEDATNTLELFWETALKMGQNDLPASKKIYSGMCQNLYLEDKKLLEDTIMLGNNICQDLKEDPSF